ncbi:MAG: ribonuclease VapC [Thermoleophilaceae bacterium]|jgi:hypothetical protein|nr:ribonuclease VapC [Thermoleophilaceae bacterium]
MDSNETLAGHPTERREPHWQPLLNFLAGDFMWMFEVACEDGRFLQAYKHRRTRRYLHLDDEGNCFAYTRDRSYVKVDPDCLLAEALGL